MSRPTRTTQNFVARTIFFAALLPVMAACGGILPAPPPPAQLYRLTPATDFPADLSKTPVQLVVDVPLAPAGVDTNRVTLSRSPTSIDYFANAEWTDRAPLLVQSMLVQSLENSGRFAAVGRDAVVLPPDFVLQSEIRHFEAVYDAAGAVKIDIDLAVRLVRSSDRRIVAQRTFRTSAVPAQNAVAAIIEAFDQASHGLARQIAVWTVQTMAKVNR